MNVGAPISDRPHLQGVGGLSALFLAVAYIVGFAAMATVLNPPDAAGPRSPAESLAFVLDRKLLFQLWMVLIYVLAGGALVVLSVGLHERLRPVAPDTMQIATPFGLIWAGLVMASGMVAVSGLETVAALHAKGDALATPAWASVGLVQNGLGGGIEFVGGVWMLLASVAALRGAALHRGLAGFGVLVGLLGLATVLPPLKDLAAVFGLGQIAWFAGVGGAMLRGRRRSPAPATSTATATATAGPARRS